MTGKTQSEAVSILRNTKLGSVVNLVVSRQEVDQQFAVPRELVRLAFRPSQTLAHLGWIVFHVITRSPRFNSSLQYCCIPHLPFRGEWSLNLQCIVHI